MIDLQVGMQPNDSSCVPAVGVSGTHSGITFSGLQALSEKKPYVWNITYFILPDIRFLLACPFGINGTLCGLGLEGLFSTRFCYVRMSLHPRNSRSFP